MQLFLTILFFFALIFSFNSIVLAMDYIKTQEIPESKYYGYILSSAILWSIIFYFKT